MAKYRLGPGGIKAIEEQIDELFDKLKVRFLGPNRTKHRISVTYERPKSLAGMFEAAAKEGGVTPDKVVLNSLIDVAENYIEAARLRAKGRIISEIQAKLAEAEAQGGMEAAEVAEQVRGILFKTMSTSTNDIKQIVEAEVNSAKNMSIFDGINQVNAKHGINDPVVFFVVVHDDALCKECKRLHLMPDGITPRLWYMSEVAHGYHGRKDNSPSMHGLHPSCRCTIVTLMPGWGFDKSGNLSFKSFGWHEILKQRGEDQPESGIENLHKVALAENQKITEGLAKLRGDNVKK